MRANTIIKLQDMINCLKEDFDTLVRLCDYGLITSNTQLNNLIIIGNKIVVLNTLLNCNTNRDKQLLSFADSINWAGVNLRAMAILASISQSKIPDPIKFGFYTSKGSELKKVLSNIEINILNDRKAIISTVEELFSPDIQKNARAVL